MTKMISNHVSNYYLIIDSANVCRRSFCSNKLFLSQTHIVWYIKFWYSSPSQQKEEYNSLNSMLSQSAFVRTITNLQSAALLRDYFRTCLLISRIQLCNRVLKPIHCSPSLDDCEFTSYVRRAIDPEAALRPYDDSCLANLWSFSDRLMINPSPCAWILESRISCPIRHIRSAIARSTEVLAFLNSQ